MFTIDGDASDMNSKEAILQQLRDNTDHYLSGEDLAQQLHISRAAIWRAIDALRAQGCQIESKSHEGYRLVKEINHLHEESILSMLDEKSREKVHVKVFHTIDSTNQEAKRLLALDCPTDTVVIARSQTSGRGRLGRSFFSPDSSGLYLSYIVKNSLPIEDALLVTSATAVALTRAIKEQFNLSVQIKWVNDLYKDGKKVAGILTEGTSDFESGNIKSMVIGLGVNIFRPKEGFPEELKDIATSLLDSEQEVMNAFAAKIITHLISVLSNLKDSSIMSEYREHSLVLGSTVSVITNNLTYKAQVLRIEDNGALTVEDEQGIEHLLNSGEISIRKL